ncbi:MAG: 3-dehydroquinate synthase [Deltaproteobacteria bacterium]|nr:3-dehydroquinate synthase [Deltaproteobacteria bacterium]MBI4374361.1 3-dehydroquinate synthase [Deltaproteobacteria bacterium]
MKTLTVDLGECSYPITIGRNEPGAIRDALRDATGDRPPVIITSPRVRRYCLSKLETAFPKKYRYQILITPDGERSKNLKTVQKIYSKLLQLKADRKSPLLLLGGGVLGDMAGFAAATYLRGVPYIQIPTTLIAQVDSSIGGKVGVDLDEGKNLVGAFYQPRAVAVDISFLKTLPPREFLAGLGEVIKYGLIEDPSLLELVSDGAGLVSNLNRLEELVFRSVKVKSRIVSSDEKETTGLRRILNFGHTFGHAVERLTRYRRYRHGEAVAIGMVLAAKLSAKIGVCPSGLAHEVKRRIQAVGLPVEAPHFPESRWLESLGVDKKREQKKIHFVFLKEMGETTVQPMEPGDLLAAIYKRWT